MGGKKMKEGREQEVTEKTELGEIQEAVDADDVPFFGDAGSPEFLGIVGLAGREEEGRHGLRLSPPQ